MATENPYPGSSTGSVPWPVYLDDRRQTADRLGRIEDKLDRVLERDAREDGQEVAEAAADQAVAGARRTRREMGRDVGLCVLSAALAVGGAVIVAGIT
jgi:hypothetical protein